MPAADLERLVRRWYVMSVLRGRYTGSPETAFDFDIRQIEARGLAAYVETVIETELPGDFLDRDAARSSWTRPRRRAPTSWPTRRPR